MFGGFVGACFAWVAAAWLSAARAETVDRLVAVVGGEPLLASQVQLDRDLAALDPAPVPFWRMSPAASRDEGSTTPDVQRSIDALVLRATAADVALYQPTRDQVADRTAAIRAAFGGDDPGDPRWEALLAARGLDAQRLEGVVRRRMVVERFLMRNLLTSPEDTAAWTAECRAMIAELRGRMRIRTVGAAAEPPADAGGGP